MSFPSAYLADVADVNWGNTSITKASYASTGFPAYSATGCDGFLPDFEYDTEGIILSAIGAKCGKCFIAKGKWTAIKNTITITPHKSTKADFRFLFYFLNREELWPRRGVGQPFIGLGDARKVRIPFPPLPEQRRIAEILDKADELRAKRRAALAKLDTLTQSIFFDMFGDPITNPRGWPEVTFGSVCDRVTVGIVVRPASHYRPHGVPALRSLNVKPGRIVLDDLVFFSKEDNERNLTKTRLRAGDVVLVRSGQPGTAAVVPTHLHGVNAIDLLIASPSASKCDPAFVCAFFNSRGGRSIVLASQRGQVQKHLNVGSLSKSIIPLPPIELQREYSRRLISAGEQTEIQTRALSEMDGLFVSLQHRAFLGEL